MAPRGARHHSQRRRRCRRRRGDGRGLTPRAVAAGLAMAPVRPGGNVARAQHTTATATVSPTSVRKPCRQAVRAGHGTNGADAGHGADSTLTNAATWHYLQRRASTSDAANDRRVRRFDRQRHGRLWRRRGKFLPHGQRHEPRGRVAERHDCDYRRCGGWRRRRNDRQPGQAVPAAPRQPSGRLAAPMRSRSTRDSPTGELAARCASQL